MENSEIDSNKFEGISMKKYIIIIYEQLKCTCKTDMHALCNMI